jgi:hypothetical protein
MHDGNNAVLCIIGGGRLNASFGVTSVTRNHSKHGSGVLLLLMKYGLIHSSLAVVVLFDDHHITAIKCFIFVCDPSFALGFVLEEDVGFLGSSSKVVVSSRSVVFLSFHGRINQSINHLVLTNW